MIAQPTLLGTSHDVAYIPAKIRPQMLTACLLTLGIHEP